MNDIEQQYERDDENVEVLEKRCTRQRLMKIILFSILLGFIIFVLIDSFGDQHVKGLSQFFLQWVQRNPVAGIICFIGVYFLATGRCCFNNSLHQLYKMSSYFTFFTIICHLLQI